MLTAGFTLSYVFTAGEVKYRWMLSLIIWTFIQYCKFENEARVQSEIFAMTLLSAHRVFIMDVRGEQGNGGGWWKDTEKRLLECRCLVPECEQANNTTFEPPWVNASAPEQHDCKRYEVRRDHNGTCTKMSFTNVTHDCNAWVYEPDEHTILNEVKWIS